MGFIFPQTMLAPWGSGGVNLVRKNSKNWPWELRQRPRPRNFPWHGCLAKAPGSGYWLLQAVPGCSGLPAALACSGCSRQLLATRCSWLLLPDPGCQILDARSWLPDPGYQILDTTSWLPDLGYQILATRSWLAQTSPDYPRLAQTSPDQPRLAQTI